MNLNWNRADVLPLLKCKTIIFGLFRVHSLGNARFIQEGVAAQYKGRTAVLSLPQSCTHQAEESRKEREKTNRAPFPRAIKHSVVKSDRQRSTGSKVPPAWPWRWIGEGREQALPAAGSDKTRLPPKGAIKGEKTDANQNV